MLLSDNINITKELSLTTGIFNLQNKNTTFKSDVNYTASITAINPVNASISYGGGAGTGRFIVERYIPTATGASPNHLKSWQFLAVPVNVDNQTVNAAWQEGQAPSVLGTSGLGTIITNNTAGSGGFDIVGGVGASMKTYVAASATWLGIAGTGITHYNQKGYMLFVRGDRSVITYNGTAVPTTLRTKGKIMEPGNPPPVTTIAAANLFESIGNPYVSEIDFRNVTKSANVQDIFYLWDPRLGGAFGYGGYQTCTKSGADYLISPGGGSYTSLNMPKDTIESGQAFFVSTVGAAGGGTVSFAEIAKVSGSRLFARPQPSVRVKRISNLLYIVSNGNHVLIDGVVNQFDRTFSNQVDMLDAVKLANTGESLGISRDGKLLAVERSGIIRDQDTIHYNLGQLRVMEYQFELIPENIARQGLKAFLIDKYLHTRTPVSLMDTTRINFSIVNIPGSYAADRFMLVFLEKDRPFIYSILDAEHMEDGNIVNWETGVENTPGTYVVERSADGINFSKIYSEPLEGTGYYSWKDTNPLAGDNYYRIHNPDPADKASYSNKVKLVIAKTATAITVYPNPVKDGVLNLRFNGLSAGDYLLKLYNNAGQLVMSGNLQHTEKVDIEHIQLSVGLANGIYKLEIIQPGGSQLSTPVFIY